MRKSRFKAITLLIAFAVLIAFAATSAFAAQAGKTGEDGSVLWSQRTSVDTAAGWMKKEITMKAEWAFAATDGVAGLTTITTARTGLANHDRGAMTGIITQKVSAIATKTVPAEGQKREPADSRTIVAKNALPEPIFTIDAVMKTAKSEAEGYGQNLDHIDPGARFFLMIG